MVKYMRNCIATRFGGELFSFERAPWKRKLVERIECRFYFRHIGEQVLVCFCLVSNQPWLDMHLRWNSTLDSLNL
jgi:hypothetical protein